MFLARSGSFVTVLCLLCGLAAANPEKGKGRIVITVTESGKDAPLPCRLHIWRGAKTAQTTSGEQDLSLHALQLIWDVFEKGDTDRDDKASFADIQVGWPRFPKDLFDKLDRDGNGILERKELPEIWLDPEKQLPGLPFWYDHVSCPGKVTLDLAPGDYTFEAARGPEYDKASLLAVVKDGETSEIALSLHRLVDLTAEGWWGGDLHVHRPVDDMAKVMAAEDLYIAPVLTWWNQRNFWDKGLPSPTVRVFDGNRFCDVMGGEDERQGGAFLYFSMSKPLALADAEGEYPSPFLFTEKAKQQDSRVWIDIEKPFWWDVPVALALGYGDSIGLAHNHMWISDVANSEAWGRPREAQYNTLRGNALYTQDLYYRILNSGLRIPPSAGTASGVMMNPVGYNRVYVNVEGPLTNEKWWEGLRNGRCFVTNGPLLRVQANGHLPGHVFQFAKGEQAQLELTGLLDGADKVPHLEIIKNGRVERIVPHEDFAKTKSLGTVAFEESGWFLVRAVADNAATFRFASTAPFYVEIGDNKRLISKAAAQFFLDWVDQRTTRLDLADPQKRAEVLVYHEKAKQFWRDRLGEANVE